MGQHSPQAPRPPGCEQSANASPHLFGIRKKVLLRRASCIAPNQRTRETLARFGHGTPRSDWIERYVYTRFSWQGVGLMLIIDLGCSVAGLTVWAVGMACADSVTAASITHGAAHY
ncbi:MAG: hypothetical protein IPH64_17650 [Comamonadaceae bacterium]|nr:hypothetical protein [Comamonadaceae bacterium]